MATDDFFRARIDQMIDLSQPLAVLARRMPWEELEKTLAPVFAHRDRQGRVTQQLGLFGLTFVIQTAAGSLYSSSRVQLSAWMCGLVASLSRKVAFRSADDILPSCVGLTVVIGPPRSGEPSQAASEGWLLPGVMCVPSSSRLKHSRGSSPHCWTTKGECVASSNCASGIEDRERKTISSA